jgi:hypothetical protein
VRGETHTAFAADSWLAFTLAWPHPSALAIVGGAALAGAAAPWCDLDLPAAWGGARRYSRRRAPVRSFLSRYGLYPRFRAHPVKYRVSQAVALAGHRHRDGAAHSLVVAAALGLAGAAALLLSPAPWSYLWWAAPALALGLASHPVLDLGNTYPVRLFWPFGPLFLGLGWTRVGGPRELRLRGLLYLAFFPLMALSVYTGVIRG